MLKPHAATHTAGTPPPSVHARPYTLTLSLPQARRETEHSDHRHPALSNFADVAAKAKKVTNKIKALGQKGEDDDEATSASGASGSDQKDKNCVIS